MVFDTELAHVKLEIRASHDHEVRKLILDYHLSIIPVFVSFDPHAQFETPIEKADLPGLTQWFDDRLVDFAKLFLSIQFVQSYQQDHMVSDPIANIRFPKTFAKSSLERDGKTFYFISDVTRAEFEKNSSSK
jgi:YHS domain-containing protein